MTRMFRRLIRCPINFFDMNPIGMFDTLHNTLYSFNYLELGRILNRFTKDVAIMDDNLPLNVFDFLQVDGTIYYINLCIKFSLISVCFT